MTDLRSLLDTKGSEFERPPLLPVGTYGSTVLAREFGKSSKKQTPYVRFSYGNLRPGDDVEMEDLEGVDLGKRTMRSDFYLTENAVFMLREHAELLGIDTEQSLGEIIEEVVGKDVNLYIAQVPSTREGSSDMFNEIRGFSVE